MHPILPSNLAYAADVEDVSLLYDIIEEIHTFIGTVKLGPAVVLRPHFLDIMTFIRNKGLRIFLDMKFHDIPNTVALAVQATNDFADIATLHLSGGVSMLNSAVRAKQENLRLIGVTCLTSDKQNNNVLDLAHVAKNHGLDGVVCSGLEVQAIKEFWPSCFAVTPGVRLEGDKLDDQERVVNPRTAIDSGADLLVIGRPITNSINRKATMQSILSY